MVLLELERIQKEKGDMEEKKSDQIRLARDLEGKILKSEDLTQSLNKNLQEDIQYERELNEKYRGEIKKYEVQKSRLMLNVQEQDEIAREVNAQNDASNLQLHREDINLDDMQREYDRNMLQLKDLVEKAEHLRDCETELRGDVHSLHGELQTMHDERNDLIFRMNDLTTKYEIYVATMTREREDMSQANKHQIKLLTLKIFSANFTKFILKRKKYGFLEIRDFANLDNLTEKRTRKLVFIFQKFTDFRARSFMNKWKNTAMDFMHESGVKENLSTQFASGKVKRRAFQEILANYQDNRNKKTDVKDGLNILGRTTKNAQKKVVFEHFRDLNEKTSHAKNKTQKVSQILLNRYQRILNLALSKWAEECRKLRERIKLEYIADDMTRTKFLQNMFLAFKDAIRQTKADKYVMKFRIFKAWEYAQVKQRLFNKAVLIGLHKEEQIQEHLMKRAFETLRFNKVSEKLDKAQGELNYEKPMRMQLEQNLSNAIEDKGNVRASQALRKFAQLGNDKLYSYFWRLKWNMLYVNKIRLKTRRLILQGSKKKEAMYFFKWKCGVTGINIGYIDKNMANCQEHIQNLDGKSVEMENELKKMGGKMRNWKAKKVFRALIFRKNCLMRKRFLKWAEKCSKVIRIQQAAGKMNKMIRHKVYNGAMKRYKNGIRTQKLDIQLGKRYNFMRGILRRHSLNTLFNCWHKYAMVTKGSRAKIKHALGHYDLCKSGKAFQQWKFALMDDKCRQQTILCKNSKNENQQLADGKKEMEKELKVRTQHENEMKNKLTAHTFKTLNNFFEFSQAHNVKSAFELWKEATEAQTRRTGLVSKYLTIVHQSEIRKVFNFWVDLVRKALNEEEEMKSVRKQRKFKRMQDMTNQNMAQLELDEEETGRQVEDLNDHVNVLAKRVEDAKRILVMRADANSYIPLRRLVFEGWRNLVKSEKDATIKLFDLANRQIMTAFLIKLKNSVLDVTENTNTERKKRNMMKFFRKCQLKTSFDKWKSHRYQSIVNEMQISQEMHQSQMEEQKAHMKRMKRVHFNKCANHMKNNKLDRLFDRWRSVIRMLKALRLGNETFGMNKAYIDLKFAVSKWRERTYTQKRLVLRTSKAKRFHEDKVEGQIFRLWKKVHIAKRSLPMTIATIGGKYNHSNKQAGLRILDDYKETGNLMRKQKRNRGQRNISKILQRIINNRKQEALGRLQTRGMNLERQDRLLKLAVNMIYAKLIRVYFNKWKSKQETATMTIEYNTFGDPAMEVHQLSVKQANLEHILAKEGYPPVTSSKSRDDGESHKKQLIRKTVMKFKSGFKGDFMRGAGVFDKWKKYVYARKAARFYFGKLYNMSYGNVELQTAWDIWKKFSLSLPVYWHKNKKQVMLNK